MGRVPTVIVFVTALGCVLAPACLTWDPGGGDPCEGVAPNQGNVNALGSWACVIAQEGRVTTGATSNTVLAGEMCDRVCGPGFGYCQLPDQYIQAYLAAQAAPMQHGPAAPDGAADGAPDSPASAVDSGVDSAPAPTSNDGGGGGDGAAEPACPHMLDSQEYILLCTNGC